jgi:hypothetical protein
MMIQGARSPWGVALFALLGAACSGEQPPPPPESPAVELAPASAVIVRGPPCSEDEDCDSGFCDRDYCAGPGPMGYMGYGEECDSNPESELSDSRCGAYLCIRNRCRSCLSDAECVTYNSGPHCRDFYAMSEKPGKNKAHGMRCGLDDPRDRLPRPPATPPTSFPKPPSYPP